MSGKQSSKSVLRALLLSSALTVVATPTFAQSSDVSVDLSAIDNPMRTTSHDRIVLRPPAGTKAVNSSAGQTIKLRAPQTAKPVAAAKPAAETPAPAAKPAPATPTVAAPVPTPAPTKTAAAPAKAPEPAKPVVPPAPTPAAPPTPKAPEPAVAKATAATAPATTTSAPPSAAAVKSAQQDQAGPAPFVLPDKQQQTAAIQKTAPAPVAEEMTTALSVPFAAGVTDIDVSGTGAVKDLAKRMSADKNLRVQLMAYATDPEKNTSKARRLALDRAIAIRNLLIEGGVERTRIEVRALGDQGEGGNLDRVDAVAVKR